MVTRKYGNSRVVAIITRHDMALFPSAKALFPSGEKDENEAGKCVWRDLGI